MDLQIKRNNHLFSLCTASGHSEKVLNDRVIGSLWGAEAINEDPYYLGMTVRELLKEAEFEEESFVISVLGEQTMSALELLNLTIVASNDEGKCPDCGSDLDCSSDAAFGIVWEEEYCMNSNCEYFSTTEPDWETL